MKLLIATVLLTAFVAVQGSLRGIQVPKSSAVTLKDYYDHSESKIISGEIAARGQFPYQAAVYMYKSNGDIEFCGGSLIGTRWVLTAGHCAYGGVNWNITLGANRIDITESGQVKFVTNTCILHPNYNPSNLNYDVALIRLPSDAELSDYIQTIRLPRRSDVGNDLFNLNVTVSGWGRIISEVPSLTKNLNWVYLTTITNEACAKVYAPGLVISSTLCCKGHPEHSTCNGDSGGPLTRVDSDGQLTQVGVVSFVSQAGCNLQYPTGFARTASFLDWISETTGIEIRP